MNIISWALIWLNILAVSEGSDYFNPYDSGKSLNSVAFGSYLFSWDAADPYVQIYRKNEPNKCLFRTLPNWPFVTIGYATDSKPPIVDGNFKVDEWTLFETPYQSIKKVTALNDEITLSGEVWGLVTKASYEMKFTLSKGGSQILFNLTASAITGTFNRLFLNYWCDTDENFYGLGVQYTYWNLKGRRIPILVAEQGIGRGAQPITAFLNLVADGVGGDPMTTYAPKPLYVTNYNRSVIIENSELLFIDTRDDDAVVIELWGSSMQGRILYGNSMLDLITEITEYTGRMKPLPEWSQRGAIVGLEGGTEEVVELVDRLDTNDVPVAGVWLQDWVGLRNAYDGDRLLWNWHLDRNYYPQWDATVAKWAQKDIRVLTYVNPFFSEVDTPGYSSVSSTTTALAATSVPISTPASTSASAPTGSPTSFSQASEVGSNERPSANRRNLLREGIENSYFVQHPEGGPYHMYSGSIKFCMLDTTNPEARIWMKNVLKRLMIEEASSSGWMADFGEYLPFDAVLWNGQSGAQYHNIYPYEWARINEEAVAEAAAEGIVGKHWKGFDSSSPTSATAKRSAASGDFILNESLPNSSKGHAAHSANAEVGELMRSTSGNDAAAKTSLADAASEVLYFMRSAWVKSPGVTSLFWLGDQLVSWDQYDGIKTVLVGFLSGGIGGHSLSHSDIGGYTMQELGPVPSVRTRELLYRWTELSAFGSAVFRTHIGLMTSPSNSQVYHDTETMGHFGRFAHIFAQLRQYRRACMEEAHLKGWPLIRSMAAHYAYDPVSWQLTSQYLFGADFLVAPVLDPASSARKASKKARNLGGYRSYGVPSVRVYLPAHSTWVHLWAGYSVEGGDRGRYVAVDAPIGAPPVFYRAGSEAGCKLRDYLLSQGFDAAAGSMAEAGDTVISVDGGGDIVAVSTVVDSRINVSLPIEGDLHYMNRIKEETVEVEETLQSANAARVLSVKSTTEKSISDSTPKFTLQVDSKALVGPIKDFVDATWMDWLGVAEYVSTWDGGIVLPAL